MSGKHHRKFHKRHVLALSVCALLVSVLLGTGASLAWFSDSDEVENLFYVADFDLDVSYMDENDTYQPLQSTTKLFNEHALYEPGYTQVVYMKIENKGVRPFDFKTAVTVIRSEESTSLLNEPLFLHKYLRFGLVTDTTEAGLMAKVDTREEAAACATMALGNYYQENRYESGPTELAGGNTMYAAVVIAMPETVGNEGNYRGKVPEVELGIAVTATQIEAR